MFEKGPILQAVRTKLNAAKARKGLSWAQLFKLCDADGSGTLDFAELLVAVRKVLGVLEQTVCIYDLKVRSSAASSVHVELQPLQRQTSQGSFSAVSKPIFASKYVLI